MPRALFIVASVLLVAAGSASAAIVYDQPLATETFTVAGEHGGQSRTLVCRRYPGFVLKSSLWGSGPYGQHFVLPYQGKAPACTTESSDARAAIYGALGGVKGRYIVTDEGSPGRAYFTIYDTATGKQLLTETATAAPDAMTLTADGFVLRYHRIYQASCSLFYGAATACWTAVKAATGLTDAMAPDCRANYDAVQRKWQLAAEKIRARPSQVTYDAETRYAGSKLTYAVRGGQAICTSAY